MNAVGGTRLDGFGVSAARRLEFGHVGHWRTLGDDDSGAVAVEFDPGDGSSVVVFVRAPNRRDMPSDFHPDDQVCLVVPDVIAELAAP
ncbi:hypothetical protein IU433_14900 [Nocardia puris]|uniref:Uncharacterized protein n=1 Tax=Nocardia puris TaxID=208602 RepID=A0A366DB97_9NOCA|nr:hypothetical protein [Nocardia puris]MBF6214622.1 hypothetical protein [Nocardia puris]MBF6366031.1 hypothetical protein [Nocardia puris]MBF6460326.1 hypothetical protein [Nocardia puris]RBO87321.1 hypothetical protein DFR74_11126 [Nocardia puris]